MERIHIHVANVSFSLTYRTLSTDASVGGIAHWKRHRCKKAESLATPTPLPVGPTQNKSKRTLLQSGFFISFLLFLPTDNLINRIRP
jgi:hypothetical protein